MVRLLDIQKESSKSLKDTAVIKINGQVVWDYKDSEMHREIRLIPSPIPSVDDPVTWKDLIELGRMDWDLVDEASLEPVVRYAITKKKTGDTFVEFFTE